MVILVYLFDRRADEGLIVDNCLAAAVTAKTAGHIAAALLGRHFVLCLFIAGLHKAENVDGVALVHLVDHTRGAVVGHEARMRNALVPLVVQIGHIQIEDGHVVVRLLPVGAKGAAQENHVLVGGVGHGQVPALRPEGGSKTAVVCDQDLVGNDPSITHITAGLRVSKYRNAITALEHTDGIKLIAENINAGRVRYGIAIRLSADGPLIHNAEVNNSVVVVKHEKNDTTTESDPIHSLFFIRHFRFSFLSVRFILHGVFIAHDL